MQEFFGITPNSKLNRSPKKCSRQQSNVQFDYVRDPILHDRWHLWHLIRKRRLRSDCLLDSFGSSGGLRWKCVLWSQVRRNLWQNCLVCGGRLRPEPPAQTHLLTCTRNARKARKVVPLCFDPKENAFKSGGPYSSFYFWARSLTHEIVKAGHKAQKNWLQRRTFTGENSFRKKLFIGIWFVWTSFRTKCDPRLFLP